MSIITKINTRALDGADLPDLDFTEQDGSDPLDTHRFYHQSLLEYEKKRLSKTSLIYYNGKPIGYFSVAMDSFEVLTNSRDALHDELRRFPAMLILQLGIDKKHRKHGLGKESCLVCIGLAREIATKRIGCRYVILKSGINMIEFFKKAGFLEATHIDKHTKWMYTKIT